MFGHMCSIQVGQAIHTEIADMDDSKLKEFKDFCVMRMAV